MNYLKQLLHQFHINQSQSQNSSQKCPEESGQFQVIEFEEDLVSQNKDNPIDSKNAVSHNQHSSPETPIRRLSIVKQHSNKPAGNQQQRLIAHKLSKEYTIIELNPLQHQSNQANNGSASTIQIDQYYMIVNSQELTRKFECEQQWQSFYKKVNDFNQQQVQSLNSSCSVSIQSSVTKSESQKKRQNISLTFKQLNSILQIRPQQIQRRIQYWNSIAVPSINIKFKHSQLASKKDPKKLEQNVTKIMDKLVPTILFEIADNKYKSIENVEDQLERWRACLIKVLTFYGANDKQIGYSKGLEYIALGILVARPFGENPTLQHGLNHFSTKSQTPQAQSPSFIVSHQNSPSQLQYISLQTHFKYFMFTKHLRNMYFPGTPKLYQQIQLLTQLMRSEIPLIYEKLQQMKVDFIKLFINYYKTFLLYKIKNPQVIRKVMELLTIYGIELVKIILTRIMSRQEKRIIAMVEEEIELLRYIAEALVEDYFGNAQTQDVILKFKQLFILDSIS